MKRRVVLAIEEMESRTLLSGLAFTTTGFLPPGMGNNPNHTPSPLHTTTLGSTFLPPGMTHTNTSHTPDVFETGVFLPPAHG